MKLFTALFLSLLIFTVHADALAKNFVVMELFTTRACANCPPVDARIKKIVDESNDTLIALACHVSFLNRKETSIENFETPDFSDPLAHSFCDDRQLEYYTSGALNKIYVPQILINGQFDTIGSAEKTVTSGLKMAQDHTPLQTISVALQTEELHITLPKMKLEKAADIWLFAYNKNSEIKGAAGLEEDDIIEYVNYVSHLEKITSWDGAYQNLTFSTQGINAQGYAVIAQYGDYTDIIAAGKVERNDSVSD